MTTASLWMQDLSPNKTLQITWRSVHSCVVYLRNIEKYRYSICCYAHTVHVVTLTFDKNRKKTACLSRWLQVLRVGRLWITLGWQLKRRESQTKKTNISSLFHHQGMTSWKVKFEQAFSYNFPIEKPIISSFLDFWSTQDAGAKISSLWTRP